MKVGETIKINGIDCVILDIQNDEVFLWTQTDKYVIFNDCDNNYKGSFLQVECDNWKEVTNLPFIKREIDLTTLNGNREYGSIKAYVAPLTFDEYRKYSEILEPHIKNSFWLATGWFKNYHNSDYTGIACGVGSDGRPNYDFYDSSSGFAPAFILPLSYFKEPPVDWSKVKVDTPILVSDDGKEWLKRYFAKFENGWVYAWRTGSASWTADDISYCWRYAKLPEKK